MRHTFKLAKKREPAAESGQFLATNAALCDAPDTLLAIAKSLSGIDMIDSSMKGGSSRPTLDAVEFIRLE